MRKPVGSLNYVTFPYGATSYPYSPSNPHAGTDYSYNPNPYAYAPEKITITSIGYLGDCGLAVDAKGQSGRTYRYCHLANDLVSVGQVVPEGGKVGVIGASGNAIGKHLHFVMWVKGTRVDPDKTIKALVSGVTRTRRVVWKDKRLYVLTDDTYIRHIPTNKRAGDIKHKKGETFDIAEYTEWSDGKKFYRARKQFKERDMRGYGKSKLRRKV